MRRVLMAGLVMVVLSGCGGGDQPVELQIEAPLWIIRNQVILKGKSFVPEGSVCPPSNEYIRIGMLGAHTITYTNAATGIAGPVFSDIWVCNSEEGRTFHWTSNPNSLNPGANPITVRMTAPGRASEAAITVLGSG